MSTAKTNGDLHPRMQVTLRLRPDLEITPQKYEGRPHFVVKDPISLRYHYFTEQEHFLLGLLDGRHTLEEARKAYEERWRPERVPQEEIESFGRQLLTAGLAFPDTPQAGQQLFERRQKRRRRELLASWTNVLYIKVPLFDPDRLLARMVPSVRWAFTTWSLAVGALVMVAALLLVASHLETFQARLPAFQDFFRWQTAVYLWLVLGVVKVVHEFGHGLSCKAFGGEVHEMGLLFLCLSPCLYCNVSDAWVVPGKWRRIIISFAGIYVELLIAALATFVWWNSPAQPFVNTVALCLMVVCSINTVVFNGNPLMRYDGYFVLADWLEIPNLRDQANRYLKRVVTETCLGLETPPEPPMVLGRRVIFVAYAVASYLYRWVITFAVLWFLYTFLKPYKLGAVGGMLAVAALASMTAWPVFRLGKSLHQRGRLPDMKTARVMLSLVVLVAGLLVFFFVPLPVSRVRQTALVQVRPEAVEKVFVPVTSTLQRLHVREGQRVARNDILAQFSCLDLENRLAEAESQYEIQGVLAASLREQAAVAGDPQQKAKLEVAQATAAGERHRYLGLVNTYRQTTRRLVLRAPRAGVVMGLPRRDEVGKLWERDQDAPFCSIGDPSRLRALVPVSPADYRLLQDDLESTRAHGTDLPITIRVRGLEAQTWSGKIAALPESEARDVPWPLTVQAGGPLPVRPGPRPHTYIPQGQQYLVAVDFLTTAPEVCPGVLAHVKIHSRWRSAAWWVWRTICTTFDLGLM